MIHVEFVCLMRVALMCLMRVEFVCVMQVEFVLVFDACEVCVYDTCGVLCLLCEEFVFLPVEFVRVCLIRCVLCLVLGVFCVWVLGVFCALIQVNFVFLSLGGAMFVFDCVCFFVE